MKKSAILGLLVSALAVTSAASHTFILDTRTAPAIPSLAYDGAIEPVPGARILRAFAQTGSQAPSELTFVRGEKSAAVTLPRNTRAAAVHYASANAGRAADGTRKIGSKIANPDVAEVSRSELETITILRGGAQTSSFPAAPLRLEPVGDIFALRVGTMITLRAILRGQPLANTQIRLQAAPSETGGLTATTGADGTVRVAIPDAGLNLFAMSYTDRDANDPDAHIVRRQSSLSFAALPVR